MRILYVSPYPPARDGIGDYTSALVTAVRDQGSDARVLLPRPAGEPAADVIGALAWRRPDWAAVERFGPDVVHIQFAVAAFGLRAAGLPRWIAALRRGLAAPVIVTMHEVTRDTALLRGPGRVLYRRIARRCDLVIVHTEAARAALTGAVGVPAAQVTVIPHPATRPPAGDAEPTALRERFGLGQDRILLAFGFIHVDKGLPDLVRALGLLRRTDPASLDGVRLVIAGAVRRRSGLFRIFEARDHLQLRRVLRRARRDGVRGNLVLTCYVPDDEVTGWFCAADAVVLPYRRIEQSGVAGIAAALGVPVLASQVGGLAEQFGGTPWTFPARDPAALAAVITRFLGDRQAWPAQDAPVPIQEISAVAAATLRAYGAVRAAQAGGLARVG
jgi:glycosyltransferase involved in cell wall biosynthesis